MAIDRFPVEEGAILLFARAIGDLNPIYTDHEHGAASEFGAVLAPPTFVQASAQFQPGYPLRPEPGKPWFGSGREPTGLRPRSGDGSAGDGGAGGEGAGGGSGGGGGGMATGLHAEQHFEYHRPLRAGDVLHAVSRPGETWEKQGRSGRLVFGEHVTEFYDEAGELVVTARTVGVRTEGPVTKGEG